MTLPDFQSDALESVTGLRLGDESESGGEHLQAVNVQVHERIKKLSGLFAPHGRLSMFSDNVEQLVDLVIGRDQLSDDNNIIDSSSQVQREELDTHCDSNSSYSHDEQSLEIKSLYRQRRRELCRMAKSYIEQNTRNNRLPWLADPLDDQNHDERVHVDYHGRLVFSDSDVPLESHRRNDLDLVDAADTFWKHQSGMTLKRDDAGYSHNQDNLAFPAPLHDMHLTREVSEQMERDARGAIERSLQRYRRHDNNIANAQRVFELIPIPITRREDVNQRWFQFRQNNNAPQENMVAGMNDNNHARLPNNLRRQPAGLDVRLAFRRICFAVVTVVAAFICTIFQDIPYLQYVEDLDGIHINSSWVMGLLGPHPDEFSDIEDLNGKHMNSSWFTGLLGPHPDELSVTPLNGRDAEPKAEISRYDHIMNGPVNDETHIEMNEGGSDVPVSYGDPNQGIDNECTDEDFLA